MTATTDSSEVTIDTTAPTLTTVNMVSDNADTSMAKAGDTITVSIEADEAVAAPTVEIAGQLAAVTTVSATR